ncbi:type II toxin-antitoxin system HicB family antitoxin [Azospirillum agricola]|uniref:type II toxin-antitoxin system HicB family antitoxin n=1 Tax=Azospirillum agricola TaxID=1720247 RepID=UPI000A0F0944|nr:type II toxin-antitoxin system HicB family antitoxin [Azospirillum agricola]MBP2227013.1 putative HicB family RNase H-like nuclease [Azospirillum agricola]SMH58950.1 Predicted nuclease of the RNAse H fold, HicB family [Azospirillum lipoferum]
MMEYKGYKAQIDFDNDEGLFVGEVINTHDGITFSGRSVDELRDSFRRAVDEYLELSCDLGGDGEQPFSGRLAIRLNPILHRAIADCAEREGKSVAAWIADCLGRAAGVSSVKTGG